MRKNTLFNGALGLPSLCVLCALCGLLPVSEGYSATYSGRGEVRGAVVPSSVSSPSPLAAAAPRRGPVIGPYDVVNKEVHFAGPNSGDVFGGKADNGAGQGNARDNTLYFHNSTVDNAFGGRAEQEATGNRLIMYDGVITNTLAGGDGKTGANSNRVELYGGKGGDSTYGGYSLNGDALNNSVLLDGAQVATLIGGKGEGNASGNEVVLNKGRAFAVTGGDSGAANANNNTVRLSGSAEVDLIVGGSAKLGAKGNRVYVSAGKVTDYVMGGESADGIAQNNSVFISGGTVGGNIIGGRSGNQAIHNTVTLSGRPDISASGVLGGTDLGAGATDLFTGNTLDVKGFQGRARTVGNFENYTFFLPAGSTNGTVVLDLSEAATLAPAGKAANVRITGLTQGTVKLQGGDVVHLIKSPALTPGGVHLTGGRFNQGVALSYEYALKESATSLYAEILGAKPSETINTPSSGPVAGSVMVNGGADVMAGAGMDSALAAAQFVRENPDSKGLGLSVFGVYTGGRTTYANADNLQLNTNHYVAGFTKLWDTDAAEILAGVYFDAGAGSYNDQRSGARAEGDSHYYGGGILARYGVTRGALSGAYVEATARAGAANSRYQNPDLSYSIGQEVKSESVTPYYSAHAGLGWVLPLGENTALDLYGKFFWSRLDASEQDIVGDKYRFDPTDSYRARGGARLSHKLGDNFSLFAGAAYEHEFDGSVQGSVHGFDVSSADIRGGTGIGEVGLSFTLGDQGNFAVDISGQGFTGQREGFAGQVRMQYSF